jgi:L-alanine-DL-glutamate epimerase-like enolase superfamily enzyme
MAVTGAALHLLPVRTRLPLRFGHEVLNEVTCARVRLAVRDRDGRSACGWGETPLSAQWAWPGDLPLPERRIAMAAFCHRLAAAWADFPESGHPLVVGARFLDGVLPLLLQAFNRDRAPAEPMPRLAALICASAFDIALHDGFGVLLRRPTYETYGAADLGAADLGRFLEPASGGPATFTGLYPSDFLQGPQRRLPAWHLVGGGDPLQPGDLDGTEPDDGHPVLLRDWIRRDGLRCLKVKLRGNDAAWDMARLRAVGRIAAEEGCDWLSADFNCTVEDPRYVSAALDQLRREDGETFRRLLYVEQPFGYDLEGTRLDVRGPAARRPLFMDESASDWRLVRLGRELGWSGVALKTCKTQTGALLSLAWARAHDMPLMVQDLTNPMLAQIPHLLLAAHAGTIMGVETNAMQFYPDASRPEAEVHPGLYARRGGCVDLATVGGPGLGYRLDRIRRQLPPPEVVCGEMPEGRGGE